MDKFYSSKELIEGIWCLNCGMNSFVKSGYSSDNRQRIMCKYCRIKTTVGAKRRGERSFDETKLLPILRKNPLSLSNSEKYVMGLIIADGCFTQGHTLSISSKDKQITDIAHKVLQTPNPAKAYDRTKDNKGIEYQLRWRYKYSKEYWNSLGLKANKTGAEEWLPYMAESNFVRGFFDGDGSLIVSDKRLSFTSANKVFLGELSLHLNKITGVKQQVPYLVHAKRTNAYGLRYRLKELLVICDYMYEDSEGLRLERKYKKYLEILNK